MATEVNVDALELVRDVVAPFVHPRETKREQVTGPPEDDILYVMVDMRAYWKLCALGGTLDRDYLESLPPAVRPSNEFLIEIERLTEQIQAIADSYEA